MSDKTIELFLAANESAEEVLEPREDDENLHDDPIPSWDESPTENEKNRQ